MITLRPARRIEGLGITLLRTFLAGAPDDAVSLGLGQVDADVSPVVRAALGQADAATRAPYGPTAGDPALRRAIADTYGVDPDAVLVTCGVQEALAVALLGLVNPGDEVVVPRPAFPVYETLTRIAGGVVRGWDLSPTDRMRPTLAGLQAAVTDTTRLVVLASPGNPTGAAAEPAEWARIGAWLEDRGIPWLSDEIYVPLQGAGGHPSMRAHGIGGLVTAGLSKTHALAGWRLGWLIVPEAVRTPLTALHQHLVTSAPSLTQQAALAAFGDEGAAEVDALVAALDRRRARAIAGLEACGFEVLSGDAGLFVWMRAPEGGDDELALATRILHDARVILIPGRAFGPAGRGHLRASIGVRDDDLDEALRRLADFAGSRGWRSRSS